MPRLAGLVLLPLFLFAVGCDMGRRGEKKKDDASDSVAKSVLVRAVHPTRGKLADTLPITGRVEAFEYADVVPKVEGVVLEVHVAEGERVEKGTLLARIENAEQTLAREAASLAVDEAKEALTQSVLAHKEAGARLAANGITVDRETRALARVQDQHTKGVVADDALEAAEIALRTAAAEKQQLEVAFERAARDIETRKLQIKNAENGLAQADLRLGHTELRATITGTVTRRQVRVGHRAQPGQAAFSIVDLDSLVLRPTLPERQLRELRVGLAAQLRTATFPDIVFHGTVEFISPEIDREKGAVEARIRLATSEPRLLPGLFVSGTIIAEERPDVLLVPKKALLFERDRAYIYLIERGDEGKKSVRRVFVRRGLENQDCVEAAAEAEDLDLDETSEVVLVGLEKLFDGAEVSLEGEESKDADAAEPEMTTETKEAEAQRDN